MSASTSAFNDDEQSVRRNVSLHWQMFVAQGVVMTILGILAIIWPEISTEAVDLYVGWIFLVGGVLGLGTIFFAPTISSFLWTLLTAGLSLFAGILLVWHPEEGAASLTLVLVAFFLVEGVFQIALSLSYRAVFPESWGWMLMSGITDLILAALIIMKWPASAKWVLGLFVGVNLISTGVAIIMVAVAVRQVVAHIESRA